MANPSHFDKLMEGVEAWNEWRSREWIKIDLSRTNLSGLDLSGVVLSGGDLRDSDLKNTQLNGAVLIGTNLSNANLSGANLSGVDLRNADLTSADLRFCSLYEVNLHETVLYNTSFQSAKCWGAKFTFTNLAHARGLASITHNGRSSIDTHTLQISGPLPYIFLRGCGLSDEWITYLPSLIGTAIEFYSCFISYSHSDKDFARRLHDTLQGAGIRCWLDEKQIKPGHDLAQEIDRGIKLWDKTILCCSKSAITEKWWVQFEMKKALAKEQDLMRERGQNVRAIIPLDLDGFLLSEYAGEYKSEIMSRSVASFKGYESDISIFDREVQNVITALRTDEGRELPPPQRL